MEINKKQVEAERREHEFASLIAKTIIEISRRNEWARDDCIEHGWGQEPCDAVDIALAKLGLALAQFDTWGTDE